MRQSQGDITGVWRVTVAEAPFPYHMFTFHADGTMLQANPPAGNTTTSDTSGMGVWRQEGQTVRARFEEFRLYYTTEVVTRGAVDFDLIVDGDTFTATSTFTIYDPQSAQPIGKPQHSPLKAVRVGAEWCSMGGITQPDEGETMSVPAI